MALSVSTTLTILDEMDYNFTDTTTQATIEDTEITDYDVVNSK